MSDDKTAPIAQVYPFAQRMAEEGVACEMHVFDQGGHGLSLGNANTAVDNEDKQDGHPSPSITCGEIVPIWGINQPIQELFHRNFVFDAPPGNCAPVLPFKVGRSFP